jgi:hypothetical protein
MRLAHHLRTVPRAALFAALAFAAPPLLFAQAQPAVTLVEPATPLLPPQFAGWQQATPAPAAVPVVADDPTTKSVFAEDGLIRSAASAYKRDASAETLQVQAYQFGDATGAFSAFTFLRSPEYRPLNGAKIGTESVEKGDSVLIWNGPAVVLAEFHGGHRTSDLTALVAVLPKAGGPKGFPPLLPTFPPTKGLEADTLKYALGPAGYQAMGGVLPPAIVGFDKSAEVVTARYSGRGLLTLLLYPTPTIAGEHGRQIEAEMNREGASAGTVKLRREGPLLLLTTGNWRPAEAQNLVENIHVHTELSWNKPMPLEFHAEVQKTASLLVSIAELSGALMLAAVVLGLFFGGGRAMLRVLQGKPAATEPEFLGINLREGPGEGGSFKPLH